MPSKDDLWEALSEYPDAKKMLLEKGREILKKVWKYFWHKKKTLQMENRTIYVNKFRKKIKFFLFNKYVQYTFC